VLPTPWGLKVIAEAREFGKATYSLPVAEKRAGQIAQIQRWFEEWLPEASSVLAGAATK
jgi:hypothetical protein